MEKEKVIIGLNEENEDLKKLLYLSEKYKNKYNLNYIEYMNEEIAEIIDNKSNARQNINIFEENKKNINFLSLMKSNKYFPMIFVLLPTATFILSNVYIFFKKNQSEKIAEFLRDNKNLIEELWKIIQQKFIEIIEQELSKIIYINNKFNFYNEDQIIEMSYYFKYICLENIHLIKKKNLYLYNILLIGKTNVGKSTLINEFLNLNKDNNDNYAEEGTGCPTPTKDFKQYFGKRNNINYVLYDTNGILLCGENNIDNSLKKFENGIKEKLINCIWYCITGSCIEEQEKILIKNLINIYSEKEILPVIIIHTKTDDLEESNLVQNELLKDENLKNNLIYLPILARKKVVGSNIYKFEIPSFGIDELEKKTKEQILDKSKNSAFLAKLRDIYKLIINKIISYKITNSLKKVYDYYFNETEETNFLSREIISSFFNLNNCNNKNSRQINEIFKEIKEKNKKSFNFILEHRYLLYLSKDKIKKEYENKDLKYKKNVNEEEFMNLFEKVIDNLICINKDKLIDKLLAEYSLYYTGTLILNEINEKIKKNEDKDLKQLFKLIYTQK